MALVFTAIWGAEPQCSELPSTFNLRVHPTKRVARLQIPDFKCLVSSSYKTDQNCRSQLNTTKNSFNDIPNSSSDFVFIVTDLSDTHQTWQFHRSHENLRTAPRIFLGTCQPDLHTGTFNLYQAVLKAQIISTPLNFGPKSGDHWKFGVF